MRIKWNWFVLIAILVAPIFAGAEVPDWIPPQAAGENPIWVSERQAIVEGELRAEIFSQHARDHNLKRLSSLARRPKSQGLDAATETECNRYSFNAHPAPDLELTLESLYSRSWQTYSGTLTDIKQGFIYGYSGMLLELTVERVFDRSREAMSPAPKHIYFVLRQAKIRTKAGLLCTRSRRHPDVPTVGARAIVFSPIEISSKNHYIVDGPEDNIFFERPDGTTSSPEFFENRPLGLLGIETMIDELDIRGK